MSRRVAPLTLVELADLPTACRGCVFWELDPAAGRQAVESGSGELEKEAWLSDTLLEWGPCGHLVHVDGQPAGFLMYAPPAYVPRAGAFATSPASADAVLLMTARVLAGYEGAGLGRVLLQTAARDLVQRGVRAIEAFGRTNAADSPHAPGGPAATSCLLPAGWLGAVGFETVRAHPYTPRLRLDLRSTASWREDVEYALDRLFASVTRPVLARG